MARKTRNQTWADILELLLAGEDHRKIENAPWMPLSIEHLGPDAEGRKLISLTHYGEQNGDLMADPDMVFAVTEGYGAEPISFRNDYAGVDQNVYDYDDDGRRVRVRPQLKSELHAFAETWFRNLREQGFLDRPEVAA